MVLVDEYEQEYLAYVSKTLTLIEDRVLSDIIEGLNK